jgi:thiol-disulfide isomerase/thioredoxin
LESSNHSNNAIIPNNLGGTRLANMKAPEKFSSPLKRTLFAALLLLLGLVHAAWAGGWNLKDDHGTHYTLSGLHGKWVLVNFWAPWCPPCLEEIPDLVAMQQQHRDLQVIGVAVMYGSRKEVTDTVSRLSVSYPIVFGNEDTAGDFGGLDGLPTSFLYTPTGKLVGHHQGILTQSEIEQVIVQKPDAAALFTR